MKYYNFGMVGRLGPNLGEALLTNKLVCEDFPEGQIANRVLGLGFVVGFYILLSWI